MPDLSNPEFIKKLNEHLASGGVIAFPTDTVWGLGALPTKAGADALFKIKHRPTNKHLTIMSDSLDHIRPFMQNHPPKAFDLAHKYWPGALTIGIPMPDDADTCVFGGVRIPDYKPFHDLCRVIDGHCLATTSANISGEPVLASANTIRQTFPDIIVIDNAYQPMGDNPSTVVVLHDNEIQVVRQGAVIIN